MSQTPGSTGNGHAGFGQRIDQIGDDAERLWTDARGAVGDLSQTLDLKGRVQRSPYGTLAVAFGVGYVLGGGLFTPLTARAIRLGMRLAALPFVKDELLAMAETAVGNLAAARERVESAPPASTTGNGSPL